MKIHQSHIKIKYRVACEDYDPKNEMLARSAHGQLTKEEMGKGWKWVERNEIDKDFLKPYIDAIENAIFLEDFDFIACEVENVPYYPGALDIFVECTLFHVGGYNFLPRYNTTISLAFAFKDGVAIRTKTEN